MTLKWSSATDQLYAVSNSSPSLDLDFASNKSLLDNISGFPLVNHQRDASSGKSAGTYVGSDGLIKTSVVNLVTYSSVDQPGWMALGQTPTVVWNGFSDPSGTKEAAEITFAGAANSQIQQTVSTFTFGVTYTYSLYARVPSGTQDFLLYRYDGGVFSQQFTATTSWQRFQTTFVGSGGVSPTVRVRCVSPVGGEVLLVWGAQLEEGSTATAYVPTTTVASAAPRFDHAPVTGESLGLLIEEERINIIDKNTSSYNSIWSNSTPGGAYNNAGIAPDGTNTAFATTAYAPVGRGQKNYSMTADTNDYTFSIFIKSTGGQGQYRTFATGFNNGDQDTLGQVAYDFATDTVGHGYSRKLYANGWVRIWKTYTNANQVTFLTTNNSSTSLDMLFWGAQVEQGSYPSSLIITPDIANVTRATDVASITGTNFSSWYNQSEGTMFADFRAPAVELSTDVRALTVAQGTSAAGILAIAKRRGPSQLLIGSYAAGQELNFSNTNWSTAQKSALAYESTGYTFAGNGSTRNNVDAMTVNPNLDNMQIGQRRFNLNELNGHISRLAYYPYRLSDTILQEITS